MRHFHWDQEDCRGFIRNSGHDRDIFIGIKKITEGLLFVILVTTVTFSLGSRILQKVYSYIYIHTYFIRPKRAFLMIKRGLICNELVSFEDLSWKVTHGIVAMQGEICYYIKQQRYESGKNCCMYFSL